MWFVLLDCEIFCSIFVLCFSSSPYTDSHTLETDFYATKSNSLRGLHLIGFFNAVVVVVFVNVVVVIVWCSSFLFILFTSSAVVDAFGTTAIVLQYTAHCIALFASFLQSHQQHQSIQQITTKTNKFSIYTVPYGTDCGNSVNEKKKMKSKHFMTSSHFTETKQCIFHPCRIDFCLRRKKKLFIQFIISLRNSCVIFFVIDLFCNFLVTRTKISRTFFSIDNTNWFCRCDLQAVLFFCRLRG